MERLHHASQTPGQISWGDLADVLSISEIGLSSLKVFPNSMNITHKYGHSGKALVVQSFYLIIF